MSKNKNFLLAGIMGAIAGVVGGVLLAPKSGKETRADLSRLAAEMSKKLTTETKETNKRVKAVFGQASKEAEVKYQEVKSKVAVELAKIKAAGDKIDKDKYVKLVEKIVDEFRTNLSISKDSGAKLAGYLKTDWEKVSRGFSPKTTTKKRSKKV